MPTLTITLNDEQYKKLQAAAVLMERKVEGQAKDFILEKLGMPLKFDLNALKKSLAETAKVTASNGAEPA